MRHTATLVALLLGTAGCCTETVEDDERIGWRGENSAVSENDKEAVKVPIAASELPSEHVITEGDIAFRHCSIDDFVDLGWPLSMVMMDDGFLVGRMLRSEKGQGDPFLTIDIYLEGNEPGAPLEPEGIREPPWPAVEHLRLLDRELTQQNFDLLAGKEPEGVFLPIAASDLPAGRRIHASDVAFIRFDSRDAEERAYPNHEVMMSEIQFIGRKLLNVKRHHSPFLLSDFEVDPDINDYLQRSRRE